MVKVEETVEFPVVLFNGERQTKIGNVGIHPTLSFQHFRTMLNEMIGISYKNLTTYFVNSSEGRKIVITSKVNFAALVKDTNVYFYVVLKRSRKDRRRKLDKQNDVMLPLYDPCLNRRPIVPQMCELIKVEIWLHEMEMKRASYVNYMSQNLSYDLNTSHVSTDFPSVNEAYHVAERSDVRTRCEHCMQVDRWGWKPVFHCCVYDKVFEGVCSSLGPIARPTK